MMLLVSSTGDINVPDERVHKPGPRLGDPVELDFSGAVDKDDPINKGGSTVIQAIADAPVALSNLTSYALSEGIPTNKKDVDQAFRDHDRKLGRRMYKDVDMPSLDSKTKSQRRGRGKRSMRSR